MVHDIMNHLNTLSIYQQRSSTDHYNELVFYTKDTSAWERLCVDIFGQPAKPTGVAPTREQEILTKEYGGIMKGQTLFLRKNTDGTLLAMFWPWQDGEHTTLKVVLIRAAGAPAAQPPPVQRGGLLARLARLFKP